MAKHRQEKGGHDRPNRANAQEGALRGSTPRTGTQAGRQQADGYRVTDRFGGEDPSRVRKDSRRRKEHDHPEDRLDDEPERREGMRATDSDGRHDPGLGHERPDRQPEPPRDTEGRDPGLH